MIIHSISMTLTLFPSGSWPRSRLTWSRHLSMRHRRPSPTPRPRSWPLRNSRSVVNPRRMRSEGYSSSDSGRMTLVYKCVYISGLERRIETKPTPGDSAINCLSAECWTNRNGWKPVLRFSLFSLWKFVHERLIPRVTFVLLNRSTRNHRRSIGLMEGSRSIP